MVRERRGGGLVVRAGARGQGPRHIRVLACLFFLRKILCPSVLKSMGAYY